jgi:hypothetical protein
MLEILWNRSLEIIGAVVGILSFATYLILEWKHIVKKWRAIKKRREKIKDIIPSKPTRRTIFLSIGCLVGVILVVNGCNREPCDMRPQRPLPGNLESLTLGSEYYHPSGIMGDISDVQIAHLLEGDRFTYETLGRGPHEWEWKYINGILNPEPAQFAGVMYLDPPGNFGRLPGYDMRDCLFLCIRRVPRALTWEARSTGGDVIVEFIIGGIVLVRDPIDDRLLVTPPWPDSMPRIVVRRVTLTPDWKSFEYVFGALPPDSFKNVVGGFSWVVDWGSNGVQLNQERRGAVNPKTFTIELRNIRYVR